MKEVYNFNVIKELLSKHSDLTMPINMLITLLLISGARISEILNIQRKDIDDIGNICLHQTKVNDFRIQYFPQILSLPDLDNMKPTEFIFTYSYKNIYDYVKGIIPEMSQKEHYKRKVRTHIFRHMYIAHMQKYFPKQYERIDFLAGQRSRRSRTFYERRPQSG